MRALGHVNRVHDVHLGIRFVENASDRYGVPVILRFVSAPAASASPPPGWPVAFRGSAAIAAGLVTKKVLRGPRYLRVFPDTYVRRDEEVDLRLRSLAAYRYVEGRGVLSGHSAAVLLGADCAPEDAPAEVTVPGGGQREHTGLLVHRGALAADEVRPCRGVLVTSGLRTGYDLGRRPGLVDAVVGIDALANVAGSIPPTSSPCRTAVRAHGASRPAASRRAG